MNKAWWEPDDEPEQPKAEEPKRKVVERVKKRPVKGERPLQVIVDEVTDPPVQEALSELGTAVRKHLEKRKEQEAQKPVGVVPPEQLAEQLSKFFSLPYTTTGNTTTYSIGTPVSVTWSDPSKAKADELTKELAKMRQAFEELQQAVKHSMSPLNHIVSDLLTENGSPREDLGEELAQVRDDLKARAGLSKVGL